MIHNGNIFDYLKMIHSGNKIDGKCKIWDFNPLFNSLLIQCHYLYLMEMINVCVRLITPVLHCINYNLLYKLYSA
jgi:hypothetical protein